MAALLELLAILTNTHSSDLSCVSPFALFGTAPSAYEDAEVFCACDGFDPELAGHVAVDILPWSVHCTVGRSRGRRTIRLAAFGCDAGVDLILVVLLTLALVFYDIVTSSFW